MSCRTNQDKAAREERQRQVQRYRLFGGYVAGYRSLYGDDVVHGFHYHNPDGSGGYPPEEPPRDDD